MGSTVNWVDAIYEYGQSYGLLQLVSLAALGAITIFRREMSCNHCYVEHESRQSVEDRSTAEGSIDWDEEEAEDILEGAGLFCSGASLMPLFLSLISAVAGSKQARNEFNRKLECAWNRISADELLDGASNVLSITSLLYDPKLPKAITIASGADSVALIQEEEEPNAFCDDLPPDVQVHILSFLHPRDVANFSCVNKSTDRVVNLAGSETSKSIWQALFYRDYAWIVESWDVGCQALERSGGADALAHAAFCFDKDFYFRFGLGYMNYVLAGHDSTERCLVGLHGHIYDMTAFILSHPGSPETVMVQAGRDATRFFDSVRHSSGAFRLAQSMCVAVDMSRIDADACGVRPTLNTTIVKSGNCTIIPPTMEQPDAHYNSQSPPQSQSVASLQSVRDAFVLQEADAVERATRQVSDLFMIGQVNVYYDPFHREFRAWYLDMSLETIFVPHID